MKHHISRFALHQNAKVFAILVALSSLVFIVPFFLLASMFAPGDMSGAGGLPMFMILVFPLVYLVLGYIMVALGCALYNFMFKFVGGIEFETSDRNA